MSVSHIRTQLRQQAAAALTGLATTGQRVFQSRIHPLDSASLPCLLVSTDSESAEVIAAGRQHRRCDLTIQAVAKESANLDATLDQIMLEVETALAGGLAVAGGLVLDSVSVRMDDGLEKPVGVAVMTWHADLFVQEGNPQ